MKIGNRTNFIFKLITTLLITITPVIAAVVVFSEYTNQKSCLEQKQVIEAIELETKPTIKCLPKLLDWNLLANKINQETNNLNVINFENQNKAQQSQLSQELASLQKFLAENKITYTLPASASYTNLASNYYTLLKQNKDKIAEATNLKFQLENELSLLNEDDQQTAKSIISLPGVSYLSQMKTINELVNKATAQLLATRNNKASIDDTTFIDFKKKLKVMTPEQFLAISDSLTTIPRPTWNKTIIEPTVDNILYSQALKRGYKYRVEANILDLTGVTETDINQDAKIELDKLIASGEKDGFNFKIASGYRNPDLQKIVFISRLDKACESILSRDCTLEDFKNGTATAPVEEVLKTSSVPGTSKHHTGRTADINETNGGALTEFKNTKSYQYLSADNFFNAKRFGFVPSYPVGGTNMGPDPEEWEFIYVGIDKLLN